MSSLTRKDFLRYAELIRKDYQEGSFSEFENRELITVGSDDAHVLYAPGEMILLFRGTENFMEELERQNKLVGYAMAFREWWWNIMTSPEEWLGTEVHRGFARNVESLMFKAMDSKTWHRFVLEHAKVVDFNRRTGGAKPLPKLTFIGHSRGGALAILAAMMLVLKYNTAPANLITYGSPRVGGVEFQNKFNDMGINGYRVVNRWDPVVCLPPPFRFRHVLEKRWARRAFFPVSQANHRIEAYIDGLAS